uniref:EGF-like domain-containing protein n=1 Tax=Rhabditophanes sp. KR3021 TaxID=114890 RepID=A0AC35UGZ3_9BILA
MDDNSIKLRCEWIGNFWCDTSLACVPTEANCFIGEGSDISIDPCKSAKCSHGCQTVGLAAKCVCPQNMFLLHDNLSCQDFSVCKINEISCDHHCQIFYGKVVCSCNEGFSKVDDTKCVPMQNEHFLTDHQREVMVLGKTDYLDERSGGHLEVTDKSVAYTDSDLDVSTTTIASIATCTNDTHFCQNNGTCMEKEILYCQCLDGFSGER